VGALALAMWMSHLALGVSVWLALPLMLPIAGLLVRAFVLMHDCAHSSFFANRAVNDTVGFIMGALTLTPFAQWRRDHALHHASSGDLDRRGHGDVPTLTVREYRARSPKGRFLYRLIRHPLSLLFGGPVHLMISQRIRGKSRATGAKQQSSVLATNVAIAAGLAIPSTSPPWRGCGCSTSSTSSRTPTGLRTRTGTTWRPRSRAART
jgi:omega-6 fatty acid desaturase (delta-12 desaturase)